MTGFLEFFRKKIKQLGAGKIAVPAPTPPVNITRIISSPKNILLVPYNRMGAILLATRVFKSIRERYPEARISVAAHSAWSVLIQNDPAIDEVIGFGDEIDDPRSPGFRAAGEALSRRGFDMALYLSYQYDLPTAYLTRLSNAAVRISFKSENEYEFSNVQIVPSPGVRYEVDRYLEMLGALGIGGSIRDYTLTIGMPIRDKARMRFFSGDLETRKDSIAGFDLTREMVGNPISRKNAEAVVAALVSELDLTVIVFFEPGKRAIAGSLKQTFGKRVLLAEDRPVSTAAGLLSFCSFVVAHNTDLFQLSIALKIPVVGILTRNDMVQWSPGASERVVHLERSALSWPSSALVAQTARRFLKTRRQAEPEEKPA
jgi:ADP-heptose:LPS heptosyltransferase